MMFKEHFKMAVATLRAAKWRSFLTMLGVIIGILSVVTTVSLGEGLKHQVAEQISHLGSDVITVRGGKLVTRDDNGNIVGVNILSGVSGSLSQQDVDLVRNTPKIKSSAPYGLITGAAETDGRTFNTGLVVGTTENLQEIINQKVEFGTFFSLGDANKHVAVVGKSVAEQLFQENVPIGRTFTLRGQEFIVRGVFEEFDNNPLQPGADFNTAIFIPYNIANELSAGTMQIFQVLVKPQDPKQTKVLADTLESGLKKAHGGEEDFTVLRQEENLAVASNVLNLITRVIAGIAGISLLVGGIGIMNIMLVSVSERTREIGLRKAVGATNSQILNQFLIEATVLSLAGGTLGISFSIAINYVIRIFTDFKPVISLPVVALTTVVSLVVGIIFGVTPAIKAARKDPIVALRNE